MHDDDDDSNVSTGRKFTATDVMQTVNRVSEMMLLEVETRCKPDTRL